MMAGEYLFSAAIKIIGINPYVSVPDEVLQHLFKVAKKDKGPIPIKGNINGKHYRQTLVRYAGAWRLYINTAMLKNSPNRIGEEITISIAFDPEERVFEMPDLLKDALEKNKAAMAVFKTLAPSRQKEINRYLSFLKTEEKINANILKVVSFLLDGAKFLGRTLDQKR